MPAALTPSGLYRARQCPAACALPAVYPPASAGATRGSVVHAALAAYLTGQPLGPALEGAPDSARALVGSIDLGAVDRLVGTGARHVEEALALDVRSGAARVLPARGSRDYRAAGASEIAGTPDVVTVEPGAVTVVDWKTGIHGLDLDAARAQLDVYALAACAVHGADAARCIVAAIGDAGELALTSWDLDWCGLSEAHAALLATWERVESARTRVAQGRTLDVTEGAWCRYCPALLSCPATVGVLARLQSPTAGEAYLAALRAEHLAEAARRRLRALVESESEVTWTDEAGRGWALRLGSDGALRRYRRAA